MSSHVDDYAVVCVDLSEESLVPLVIATIGAVVVEEGVVEVDEGILPLVVVVLVPLAPVVFSSKFSGPKLKGSNSSM